MIRSQRESWQNVTVTFDQENKRVKFYINGVLGSEKPLGNNAVDALTALFVGAHKVPTNNDPHAMKGDIDELRVYEKVLSDEESQWRLYAEKGVELEKTAFADAVQEARELYDSGALSPSSPYAQALLETIEDGEAALAQEDLTLSELRAAAAALENAVNAYQALVHGRALRTGGRCGKNDRQRIHLRYQPPVCVQWLRHL